MIERDLASKLKAAARSFPAVTLTGPRQSGKSTLCRGVFPNHAYANLEAPDVRSFAQQDPRAFLAQFPKGAVIDEVQRCPELPSYLQVLIDQDSTARQVDTDRLSESCSARIHKSVSCRAYRYSQPPSTRA